MVSSSDACCYRGIFIDNVQLLKTPPLVCIVGIDRHPRSIRYARLQLFTFPFRSLNLTDKIPGHGRTEGLEAALPSYRIFSPNMPVPGSGGQTHRDVIVAVTKDIIIREQVIVKHLSLKCFTLNCNV